MRILFVNSGLRFGGAETQIIRLARKLVERGHDVSLYLLSEDVPRLSELDGSGVDVIVGRKSRKLDLRELSALRRHIREWRPDVVKSFLFDANFYTRLAAFGSRLKVINGERNHDYALSRSQALAHYSTCWMADAVVANTFAGRVFAARRFHLPARRAHVVWNGIDVPAARAMVRDCGEVRAGLFAGVGVKLMIFVAALRPAKDVILAVQTARELAGRDAAWRFVFVGDTVTSGGYKSAAVLAEEGYKEQVLAEARDAGIMPRCTFLGERRDAIRLIAASDVMLCTSRHEGFPNVVLEAMTVGTPVVSTDVSDIRRILPLPWQTVEHRDARVLADAVERAYAERDDIAPLQLAFVEGSATLDHACAALERVLRQYARGAGPGLKTAS
jgi:glycosyltransferase involved in cell wall biosynthesis